MTNAARTEEATASFRARIRQSFVFGRFELVGLALALAVLCITFTHLSPYFLTGPNLKAVGVAVSLTGILAAAQTVVIVSGSIDLSFASILALTGIAAQKLLTLGAPFPVVVAGALLVGALCGLINAAIVVWGGVNPLIAADPVLSARGLSKHYGPVTALDDVDIDIFPGEILAVVGDNGAGKSTLVKILSGAIVPDAYEWLLRTHGCRGLLLADVDWGTRMAACNLLPPVVQDEEGRWAHIWHERLGGDPPWFMGWHGEPPGPDFWRRRRIPLGAIEVPTFAICGWHDAYTAPAFRIFQEVGAPFRFLIGPWKHALPDLSPVLPIGGVHEMERWWDRWLKGVNNGVEEEPPITIFVQGAGAWRHETEWPIARTVRRRLHLADGGALDAASPELRPIGGLPVRLTGGDGLDRIQRSPSSSPDPRRYPCPIRQSQQGSSADRGLHPARGVESATLPTAAFAVVTNRSGGSV